MSGRVAHGDGFPCEVSYFGPEGEACLLLDGVLLAEISFQGSLPGPEQDEVYLRPGSLDGSMFRFLRQGQRITFDGVEEDGKTFVTNVRVGHDGY